MSLSKLTPEEAEEVARLLSGGDPDYDDDPAAYDPPAPLSDDDAAAADAILEREKGKR